MGNKKIDPYPSITHHPSVKFKKFRGSKMRKIRIEIKKSFLGEDIKLKETQRGPLGGPLRVPSPGDKGSS